MSLLLLVVFLTLFISANCSLYEAILYSARPGALEAARNKPGMRVRALAMLEMKRNISSPIAAILVLNTLANTAGATVAGMLAADVFPGWGVLAFSAAFTIAILLLSEIVPKTAGAVHWRSLWPYVVLPVRIIRIGLRPLVHVVQRFAAFFDSSGNSHVTITEDEILALVNVGAREGQVSRDEGRMVNNIIKLDTKVAADIMTPRTVVYSVSDDLSTGKAFDLAMDCGFSRIPVYNGEPDNVTGYVLLQDLEPSRSKRGTPLADLVRPITRVPQTASALGILMAFLKGKRQIALVEDEFGGVAGVLSMEDLLEAILGVEIVDETDRVVDTREAARRKPRPRKAQKKKKARKGKR